MDHVLVAFNILGLSTFEGGEESCRKMALNPQLPFNSEKKYEIFLKKNTKKPYYFIIKDCFWKVRKFSPCYFLTNYFNAGVLRDKTMDDKFMYIPNNDEKY